MKDIIYRLVLTTTFLCIGCRTTSPQRDFSGIPATEIDATVTCSDSAMKFTGGIVSDGHAEECSGTGSGTYHVTGHEVLFSFKKLQADGRLSLSAGEPGQHPGGASTIDPFGGVRARFLRLPQENRTVFTTFR